MEIMILIVIAYRECQTINVIRIGIEVGSYKPIIIIDTTNRSVHRYEKQYDELISLARSENPLPEQKEVRRGKPKRGKILDFLGN